MSKEDGLKTNGFASEKVQGFLKEVDKIDDWAASEIGKINNKKKEKLGDVRSAADQIGIKKSVFNATMKEHRLIRKADAVRDSFAANHEDDHDLVDQLDNVRLAAGLPLFEAADAKVVSIEAADHGAFACLASI